MRVGNFIALASYYMVICAIFAFGAHLLRRAIGIVSDWSGDGIGLPTKEKVQNESDEGASSLREGMQRLSATPSISGIRSPPPKIKTARHHFEGFFRTVSTCTDVRSRSILLQKPFSTREHKLSGLY